MEFLNTAPFASSPAAMRPQTLQRHRDAQPQLGTSRMLPSLRCYCVTKHGRTQTGVSKILSIIKIMNEHKNIYYLVKFKVEQKIVQRDKKNSR